MLRENAKYYYIDKSKHCSDGIISATNEYYNLGITDEQTRLFAGFAAGMGCGKACGALAGAVATLGNVFYARSNMKEIVADFVALFEKELGSTECEQLVKKYRNDETRCLAVVEKAADLLEAYIKKLKEEPSLVAEDIKRVKGDGFLNHRGTNKFNARVITRNGRVSSEEVQKIADAANTYGDGKMMFTTRLTVEVSGIDFENIEPFKAAIEAAGLSVGGTGAKVRPVVSCKGSTCQYGIYDTYALSEEIHNRFYLGYRGVALHHKFKIAVGGCPNNCVKPSLNDVGIFGARIPNYNPEECKGCKKCKMEEACPIGAAKLVDGKLVIDEDKCLQCGRCTRKCRFSCAHTYQDGWKIVLGGRWGKEISIGRQIDKIFTDKEEVLDTVEKIILYYRLKGKKGERFAQTIDRIGFDKVQKAILTNEMLERKEEILNK